MQKKLTLLTILLCFLMSVCLVSCERNNKTKIKVAEVAHSVFYAPQYVAIYEGYFEEVGLEIELINANGADKVTASLLSKDVQIGLQGPEPTIYLYNNDQSNYLINFAQLTQTDGSFLFGRNNIENFSLEMLKNKTIIGGRLGGVPEMTLEYILKEAGLKVVRDETPLNGEVNIRTDVAFNAMAGAFLSGEGDFVTLFEPTATDLVKEGKAYLLCAIGDYAKRVPYTAYSTTKSYYENNQNVLKKFVQALYKGQQFVKNHSDYEVAKIIIKAFPEQNIDTLTDVVARYRGVNAWCESPYFDEDGYIRLLNIISEAGELQNRPPYNKLVSNTLVNEILYK